MKNFKYITLIFAILLLQASSCKTGEENFIAKEAKRLTDQGFYNVPGDLPVMKQLEESFRLRQEKDAEGRPRYYLSTQEAKAETFAAAKEQAQQLCLANIASQIGSNILGRIKSNLANSESAKDAASVTEVIAAYQNTVMSKLGRTEPIVILKGQDARGFTKIFMTVKYDMKSAEEMVKRDLRKELKQKTNELQSEIDKMLDLDGE